MARPSLPPQVYSLGFHQAMLELTAHAADRGLLQLAIWRGFAMLWDSALQAGRGAGRVRPIEPGSGGRGAALRRDMPDAARVAAHVHTKQRCSARRWPCIVMR